MKVYSSSDIENRFQVAGFGSLAGASVKVRHTTWRHLWIGRWVRRAWIGVERYAHQPRPVPSVNFYRNRADRVLALRVRLPFRRAFELGLRWRGRAIPWTP